MESNTCKTEVLEEMLSLAKEGVCLCFNHGVWTVLNRKVIFGKKGCRHCELHFEIQSVTKKIGQEMIDKLTQEGQKDMKIKWVLPTTKGIQMSRMFIKDHITVAIWRNTLEKIQKRKNQPWCYIYPLKTTKRLVSCLFHCSLTMKARFQNINPGKKKILTPPHTHTHKR